MFLEESKARNCDYLEINFKVLGMTVIKRKGENISHALPKLKSTMHQRTYKAGEKMTHKKVENICKSHAH